MSEDAWRIEGGARLKGSVKLSGSKNGSLPSLAATLLFEGESTLTNIPRIADVDTMLDLLCAFGLEVARRPDGEVRIVNRGLTTHSAPADLASKMRASHYVLAPVLHHRGQVEMAMPGGCDLGARPVTHITSVLETLGTALEEGDTIRLSTSGLRGSVVTLDPRHRNPGATFTGLMAGAVAPGETIIENASFEPDVVCFCELLSAAGARITGLGTPTLTIQGVDRLQGVAHAVNCDRLEAGTFICAAAATRGDITVSDIIWEELGQTADKLLEAGIELTQQRQGLRAQCLDRPRGVDIVTDPFPAFSTDLQPPVAAVLATAEGDSTIRETVFDHRLRYASELGKMGARVELGDERFATIHGVDCLQAAEVSGGNIRDGAALVVAALGADGVSVVHGRRFVARGYEDFESKLQSLGARIGVAG
ncbi:MAG: UDP-N-acetylglucosamine 1-carboxyvinyltransferase [Armatimonadetes bacterium]|nr:UDP-N-acetylglucosamine 1-carboxyvinyltransferase [Armatimonadota bacterium]